MPPKRKTPSTPAYTDPSGTKPNKRSKTSRPQPKITDTIRGPTDAVPEPTTNGTISKDPDEPGFDHTRPEELSGIVNREFYPAEMSNERCAMYNEGEIPRPMSVLEAALAESREAREKVEVGEAVVHWFKRDLRIRDNTALSMAAAKAKEKGVGLICVFIVSPQDYEAHLTSAVRVDFELRTLSIMKAELAELDIPLYVETVEKRTNVVGRLIELAKEWKANHIYCNVEYEVDELRREEKLVKKCLAAGIAFEAVHDDCIVPPGVLKTGAGRQYAVYSPWFRAWIAYLHAHPELLLERPMPSKNPPSFRQGFAHLFDAPIPTAPPNKLLDPDRKERMTHLWPAGEHEALARLERFLTEKIGRYKDTRSFPSANSTACLSVHHSAGTLAARTSVRMARDVNSTKKLDGGIEGIRGWIGEVAWRDFYKHVLVAFPYICMHKPFKYEYTNIEWEYNDAHFEAWSTGRTGYPIVDAGIRQLLAMGYMHNRLRMITASFLAKHLLLDWRLGERFFMLNLIDGDFASNNGGWGFSASVGVDPQPYFRIFNPWLQSEKFDPQGEFIKKWVPELRGIEGEAIHNPYERGAGEEAERMGYPRPIVEHKFARERALKRYKTGIGRDTA